MATQFFSPTGLDDAIKLLADPKLQATAVAGCTDLMVVDHATGQERGAVVDLLRLDALQGISDVDGFIDIGAAETFWSIRQNSLIQEYLPTLAAVAKTVGAWQIQNRATIGGNIANASPAGDSLPVLLSLGAQLLLKGPEGERLLPYENMHLAYRKTALKPGEIIVRVRVPKQPEGTVTLFKKVGTREAQAISKVVVACALSMKEGMVQSARIAAGSVAATPVRLKLAEEAITGALLEGNVINAAVKAAREEVRPIDDVRSTAEYRHFALGQVLWRMLHQAARQ